jgi:ubiquinol-cytochrome c reductase iron-sulfur subunit
MSEEVDQGRRSLLVAATTATGAIGVAFAATPFLVSWKPSARARAMGAPVEVDVSKLEPGAMMKVEWRGQPIFVLRRTPEMVATLDKDTDLLADPGSEISEQPEYAKNNARSIKPDVLVVKAVCTHLGCAPQAVFEVGAADLSARVGREWPGGFFCPCHGSMFDLAGRVMKNVPAPKNLIIPPYSWMDDSHILVGQDPKGVA